MASVCNDKNGTKRVTFLTRDGKHRSLRLGKVSKKQAESFRGRVELLLQNKALGSTYDAAVIEWIKALPPLTRRRLEAVDLLEPATGAITLATLIERFMKARTVKDGTMATYKQCTDSLLKHLGAETPIDKITPADAEQWKASIAKSGRVREKEGPRSLAPATVAKRMNIAKAIFRRRSPYGARRLRRNLNTPSASCRLLPNCSPSCSSSSRLPRTAPSRWSPRPTRRM
jgi:hypothetical protein